MNMKMKTLSLAVLGLAGLAFAGSASAACVQGNLSAWSASTPFQGTLTVVGPGLTVAPAVASECRLNASINVGAGGAAFAAVSDTTPAAEARYRAQFLINADGLTAQGLLAQAQLFSANSTANGAGLRLGIFGNGAGGRNLSYVLRDSTQPSGLRSGAIALAAGVNRIEMDLNVGASATVRFWVNNTVEASATTTVTGVNNTGYGVDTIFLGLGGPSTQYITAHAGAIVAFDQFDSRRQTFIGG